jgi:lactoylglutathione lyase
LSEQRPHHQQAALCPFAGLLHPVVAAAAGEPMAAMIELAICPNRKADVAAGFEIAFVTTDPEAAYGRAVDAGASAVKPPTLEPWGQTVGYVRDLNGCRVELCSSIAR